MSDTSELAGPTPEPTRVLVVTAHPDDVDFGAGGTVGSLTAAGVEVGYCIVTDGDAGGFDRGIDRSQMSGIRQAEQRRAAAILGVDRVTFLGYPDGALVASLELRRDISRVIRTFRPERVICQSPERDFDRLPASHPDHLAAGEAALCAVYPDARNPFAFPELLAEGLEPHAVHDIWLMAHPRATVHVDITATIAQKIAALFAHASQLTEPERTAELVREWGVRTAAAAGLGEGRYAESFLRVTAW